MNTVETRKGTTSRNRSLEDRRALNIPGRGKRREILEWPIRVVPHVDSVTAWEERVDIRTIFRHVSRTGRSHRHIEAAAVPRSGSSSHFILRRKAPRRPPRRTPRHRQRNRQKRGAPRRLRHPARSRDAPQCTTWMIHAPSRATHTAVSIEVRVPMRNRSAKAGSSRNSAKRPSPLTATTTAMSSA